MSVLKTVENTHNLRVLEKKLSLVMRDYVSLTGELQTVSRSFEAASNRLNILTTMREIQTSRKAFGALKGSQLEKAEKLDSNRELLTQKRDDLLDKVDILESELADGKDVQEKQSELDNVRSELDKLDREIDGITDEIDDMIKAEKAEFDAEMAELTAQQNELADDRDVLDSQVTEKGKECDLIKEQIADLKSNNKRFSVTKTAKRTIKATAAVGLNTAKSITKSGLKQVDPLSQNINKDDVTDTGMESLRLTRQAANKTTIAIKTTQRTVKTTTRTIKNTKNAAINAAKTTYKLAQKTAKIAILTAKIAVKAVTHIIAFLVNPIFWVIAGILLIATLLSSVIILLMGGANGGQATMAAMGAVGLGDVPEAYLQGVEYFNTALENAKSEHNAFINAASSNDLIFMQVTRSDGTVVQYSTAFATAAQKNFLSNAPWTYPLNENLLDTNNTLAIAYVLLQKRANAENDTSGIIYSVSFMQEIFDEIIGLSVEYNSTIYPNQPCPGQNCSSYSDEYGTYYYCPHNHNLYAIGLWYYSQNDVMDSLEFTNAEKEWVMLTVSGFEANPNIL